MISVTELARLTVSAASGCVVHDGKLWVVADDDVRLFTYSLRGEPLESIALLDDQLSADAGERKKQKPDFEALTVMPDGSLLAFGSGSGTEARRNRAVWVRGGVVKVIDCEPLFTRLSREFAQLNVEGAVVQGDVLVLGQRGNGEKGENALVKLELSSVVQSLVAGTLSPEFRAIDRLTLGKLDGVALSLTDLALDAERRLCFSAAAEDTTDPYLDGECKGSVLGGLDDAGRVTWSRPISECAKIEGLAHLEGDRWLLVADPDDPTVRAPLYEARVTGA